MKGKILTVGLAVVSLGLILLPIAAPSIAFADHNAVNSSVFIPTILAGPLTLCVGAPSTSGKSFPICNNLCDLVAQVAQVIYYAIAVVIWIITPVLVAVGGIMIMLGGANPGLVETGKKTMTGAVWGVVIVLCAWLIVFTFISAFGKLGTYIRGFGGPVCSVQGSSSSGGVGGGNGNSGGASSTNPFGNGGDSGGGGASSNF